MEQLLANSSIKQFWVGDSHLRRGHSVPQAYSLLRSRSDQRDVRFRAPGRLPCTDPSKEPGYYLDDPFLSFLKRAIETHAGSPTCFVISVGTNDIRAAVSGATVPRDGVATELLALFQPILKQAAETPGIVMLVLAPIPCWRGVEDIRAEYDNGLRQLCEGLGQGSEGKVRYIDVVNTYFPKDPSSGARARPLFWSDELHLNEAGAHMVAVEILRVQRTLSDQLFMGTVAAGDEAGTEHPLEVHDEGMEIEQDNGQGPQHQGPVPAPLPSPFQQNIAGNPGKGDLRRQLNINRATAAAKAAIEKKRREDKIRKEKEEADREAARVANIMTADGDTLTKFLHVNRWVESTQKKIETEFGVAITPLNTRGKRGVGKARNWKWWEKKKGKGKGKGGPVDQPRPQPTQSGAGTSGARTNKEGNSVRGRRGGRQYHNPRHIYYQDAQ